MRLTTIFTALVAGSAIVSAFPAKKPNDPTDVGELGEMSEMSEMSEMNEMSETAESNTDDVVEVSSDAAEVASDNIGIQLPAKAPNTTAAFEPNWEGAVIGGAILAELGALLGAGLGAFTTWTFNGFQKGLTDLVGFDPISAIANLPPAAVPSTPISLPPLPPGLGGLFVPAPTAPPTAAAAGATPKPATPPSAMPKMGHNHGRRK